MDGRAAFATVFTFANVAGCAGRGTSRDISGSPSRGHDWRSRTFAAPPEGVFQAAEKAVLRKYRVEYNDPDRRVIRFHVGTTAWSWGYNMNLTVEPTEAGGSIARVEVEKSGGPVLSWGSGGKEVTQIFQWMDQELTNAKAASSPGRDGDAAGASPDAAQPGVYRITSIPEGAQIRADGALVGQSPALLRLPPGKHTIKVSMDGFADWTADVTVLPDSEVTVKATMERPIRKSRAR